jgi:hypothetical protein
MAVGLIILILATVVITIHLAQKARQEGRVAPLWSVVAINGVGVILTMIVVGSGWYFVKQYQYDRCVATAEARTSNRLQHVALYDVIDAATHSTRFTGEAIIPGTPSLREGLDENLPPLNPRDCAKP